MEKIAINALKNYALPKTLRPTQSKSKDNKRNYVPLILYQDSKKYILGIDIEGTTLSECHEKFSGRDFKCQVLPSSKEVGQLEAHIRMTKSVHVAFPVDLFLEADIQYLVFEKGHGNMHTQIKDLKFLPEDVAKALFLQMVEAVADCHSAGIVLNDMKLRRFIFSNSLKTNLCIENLNGCVLLQPGESDDKRYSKTSNPFYISPEAIRGGKAGHYKGRPSDVWSLGIMMYTMLCGRYPFHDANPIIQLSKILGGKYITPPEMSFKAKCLISKMLNRDPSERLSAKAILSHAWFDSPEDLKNNALKLEKFDERIQVVPDCVNV